MDGFEMRFLTMPTLPDCPWSISDQLSLTRSAFDMAID
jgi:hypothetical protein